MWLAGGGDSYMFYSGLSVISGERDAHLAAFVYFAHFALARALASWFMLGIILSGALGVEER